MVFIGMAGGRAVVVWSAPEKCENKDLIIIAKGVSSYLCKL